MGDKPFISTNPEQLHAKSEPVLSTIDGTEIVSKLLAAMPDTALGLAAPQILEFKRVFVANLSSGKFAFINPRLESKSLDQVPSKEACLSLPNIVRTVNRYRQVTIDADSILTVGEGLPKMVSAMTLSGQDAFIVQHEYDHLEGVLITDLPEVKTEQDKVLDKQKKRMAKIAKHRQEKRLRKNSSKPKSKLSAKTILKRQAEEKKRKKKDRRKDKQEQIRVKVQEMEKIVQEGLFEEPSKPNISD